MREFLDFRYNDGGRSKYFRAADVRDCVVRATAIASGRDYKEVYNLYKKVSGKTPRNGVDRKYCRQVIEMLGGKWTPCMKIGTGCKVHLMKDEIPMTGRVIVSLSRHLCAIVDGVINDTYNPSRDGERCVYGYWKF